MLLSGTDLTTVSRFKNKSQKFAEKILSEQEYVQFQKMEDERQKSLFLARVWAIKESIYKVDNCFYDFRKINLVKINGRWTFRDFSISISHERNLLIAFVVKYVDDKEKKCQI
ncbi:4'-phosphopantetheinyl transferase superfamily protein [Mycoplasmopsis cynos]|uniref:4'-phosphopantetheinyl transferase superfamily protein n=1 Tax=Mycoplasmopsis cynos TaxID=171284 RepID=UPI0022020239|nr:4'-phosphopantetheinyl transferase superfamily protein [Mycoplasmopsis cynos]UWV82081.1 4'-phosphopantetheinyl transferase superfamily protein [Mycoplasmopsis cynos]UWV93090.1 4'-phosphopantetheinyl transferase superfamily protein [Mycoplasmopsis cynos]WAM05237.1 4'-phosphopantetheinyl transferase superfamily protein [Mycoplasmopsis cynos]WAM11507.1 4'-phosphopantetheinyl transferase superfamily protein [Mycoplasmopsis cynos]